MDPFKIENLQNLKQQSWFNPLCTGLFPAILGKGGRPKLGKNDRLNIKIGRN